MKAGSVVVCALILGLAGAARADDGDKAAAEAAFLKAKDLIKAGDVAGACEAFGRSQTLDPQNGTEYNLALCNEKLGRFASAWIAFRELAQRDTNASRKKDSEKRARALSARLTKMLINVDFAAVPGVRITRNGVDVTAQVGIETPVDAGDYTIVASADGYQTFSAQVSATGEGMTVTVAIPSMEKLPEDTTVAVPPPDVDDHHEDVTVVAPRRARKAGHGKLIGVLVGSAGLAIAGGGAVFGVLASGAWADAKAICGDDLACPTDADTDRANALAADARTDGNLSTVLVGVGAAAIVTGVVLYLIAPSSSGGDEHALLVAPTRGGAVLSFSGAL
jgi:hypothetical protein